MIFQQRAKKCIESNCYMDSELVKIVQSYTCSGTLISSTGNFSLALDKLKEKALDVLFSPKNATNLGKLSPFLANKIFDVVISPILTYNSEVWGAYTKSDLKVLGQFQDRKNLSPIL